MSTTARRREWGKAIRLFDATLTSLLLLGVSWVLFGALTVEGKGVQVTVTAPWTETPLLQEGCEMVAARGALGGGFYHCLQEVWQRVQAMNNIGGAQRLTQKSQSDVLLDMMLKDKWPSIQVDLAKMKLAARLYSPAVEAHWQLARTARKLAGGCSIEGRPFVLVAGKVVCSEDLLEEILAAPGFADKPWEGKEDETFAIFVGLDHIHPGSMGGRVIILYGVVGEEQTMRFLQVAERHLHLVRLAFRHLPVVGRMWEKALHVQGYGVTVDLKNVEYKVINEKKNDEAEMDIDDADTISETESLGTVGGFNIALLVQRYPQLRLQLTTFAGYLADMIDRDEVKVDFQMWETQYMGIAAAQQVMDTANEKRLGVLMNFMTKFPLYASKLSKMGASVNKKMNTTMQEELLAFAGVLHSGTPQIFLNGRRVSNADFNLFSLLEKLEADEELYEGVQRILTSYRVPSANDDGFVSVNKDGINQVMKLLTRNANQRITSYGLEKGDTALRVWMPQREILWLNNLEQDVRFVYMPSALRAILRMGLNGIPTIPRKNLIHAVSVVDPTTPEGAQDISTILKLDQSNQPIRFGIVFADSEWKPQISVSTEGNTVHLKPSLSSVTAFIAATVWELLKGEEHLQDVLEFLSDISFTLVQHGSIKEEEVLSFSANVLALSGKRGVMDIITDPSFLEHYQATQANLRKLKLDKFPLTLINGNLFRGNVLQSLRQGFLTELLHVRELVENGALTDADSVDFYEAILRLSGARERYNDALYKDKTYMDWTLKPILDFLHHWPFLLPPGKSKRPPLVSSVLVIQSPVGATALSALVKATNNLLQCVDETEKCMHVRLTYVICDVATEAKHRTLVGDLERLLLSRKEGEDVNQRLQLVQEFLLKIIAQNKTRQLNDSEAYESWVTNVEFPAELQGLLDVSDAGLSAQLQTQRGVSNGFCAQVKAESSSTVLSWSDEALAREQKKDKEAVYYYVNGRRFVYDDSFAEEDFKEADQQELLLAVAMSEALSEVNFTMLSDELQQSDLDSPFYASKVAALKELWRRNVARGSPTDEERSLPSTSGLTSFVVQPVNAGTEPRHTLTIVIDPVAQQSQLPVSLCNYVTRSPLGVSCIVHMGTLQQAVKPMRNFYEFVSELEMRFDGVGGVLPPTALFHRLPSQHLLTLGVEEPESWTVFPLDAKYDLDNIVLDKLPSSSQYVHATYRINSILLTGSAREAGRSAPARGLPLLIRSTNTNPSAGLTRDTIAMAILGYFQLQSTPGVWYLTVQPGDYAETFYISQVNGIPVNDALNKRHSDRFNYTAGQNIPVVISSFTGKFLTLDVSKAPGREKITMEDIEAAYPEHADWPPGGPRTRKPRHPTLNIFSVASGHLYERFLRMMIHSVMQTSSDIHGANTTRIKFWFIENFLSPQFKTLIPLLAKHYGFDVALVTYRWPWWLHKQTEKQRIIWAYKVLFLDVLFPLDVERVIFVDADQTVQADLHDLYNMNIGGAPTAYTPFCRKHPNQATKNFRFWDQGFWMKHLRGRPYHISAIYLVNLRRLRAIAGGDKYRMVYSQLSPDPNSLANLDQDLPNFMQEEVPIYSLPEEWLWCETWCGAESKARAKTIDLCNNPLTKMPKLDNAKLIIPNWEETDTELEALSEKLLKQHRQQEREGN
ncbi:UDP-glucose:glycoprotein glucosyltransferase [Trypanosoma rangeli]|uniref:UDP-glucose:glycoprotein glucosyltransferase n=1 Tax=Trypanosoma rangeli TaxID=5698 RepID=A0A422NKU5_TRYRA|nr:UDP-glucose:glycoprotein glucosyltransferase [Trypanosoma rangeli]RNF06107.1 UDP-glucose:glycoprotein glucosyltransferase [Trypanosoma rangeli]|eukprot:RNF06107.1 UDP-glucose:glycoprotein glucosyltransferase [Trypanosoma rangeli]